LSNIDENWRDARVIIANTCISVGNNYAGRDYNRIFAYFANWVDIREFIQVLYRIRNPIDKVMYIYYERRKAAMDEYRDNRLVVEDAAFKELKKDFIVEDKIEGKDAFNILANRCNITLAPKSELYESVKEMAPYIPEEFEVKYSDIRDIAVVEYNRHRTMIETGFCSLVRKLEYEKSLLIQQSRSMLIG
jgi:hypothetical protein